MYYFLRWTSDPNGDIKRNFSGHMQAWYKTREEAYKDYEKEKAKGRFSLQWFKDRYGDDEGEMKYKERSEKLRNRKDQSKDSNGRFIKKG